jgi:superoxide dismutase
MEGLIFTYKYQKIKAKGNELQGNCLLLLVKKAKKLIISSSYDDSYEVFSYACALLSYDVYVFFRKAYSISFILLKNYCFYLFFHYTFAFFSESV